VVGPIAVFSGAALAVVVVISAIPSGPSGGGSGTAPPQAAPIPIAWSSLTSGNAHLGEMFHLSVHTRPQVGVWILASSNTGPSMIGPYLTDLGPDWFILQSGTWTGGGNRVDLDFPIPTAPALQDLEVIIQAFIQEPSTSGTAWTPSVLHRITAPPLMGRSVLLIRQTMNSPEIQNASAQADALQLILASFGHAVTVADDAYPADLASFDCLMDCRFTVPPTEAEKLAAVRFLQHYGGIFLLCGPYLSSPMGQARLAALQELLNARLGIGVTVASGGNTSGGPASEQVSPMSDPRYLTFPAPVSGLAVHVEQEGGNFGPEGYATRGLPWVSGTSGLHLVYGMFFKPDDMPAVRVRGAMAVLFNGAADALMLSPANPNAHLIFVNLPWYLDQ
jgi:hypothetical protein